MKTISSQAIVLLCTIILPCAGQEAATTRPDALSDAITGALQPESVSAEMRRLESVDLEPAVKKAALGFYAQALEHLEATQTWAEQSRRLEQVRRDAPAQLAVLKARLSQAASQPATAPQPFIPSDMTLEDLDQMVRNADAEARAKQQTLSSEEETIAVRTQRRESLLNKISECEDKLAEVRQKLEDPASAQAAPDVSAAQRTMLGAHRRALESEIAAYQHELATYDAVGLEYLTCRRDVARLELVQAEASLASWRQAADRKRLAEIGRQQQEATQELTRLPQALRDVADETRRLADERRAVNVRISQAVAKTKALETEAARLEADLKNLRDRLRVGGMVADVGPILNRQKAQLPEIGSYRREARVIRNAVAHAQVRLLELEEARSGMADPAEESASLRAALRESQPGVDVARFEPDIERLLRVRLEASDSLRLEYETCWNTLIALGVANGKAIKSTESLLNFINEHVLWLPSDPPIHRAALPESMRIPRGTWATLQDVAVMDLLAHPLLYGVLALLGIAWLASWGRVARLRGQIDRRVAHQYADSFTLTVQALLIDIYRAIPLATVAWFAGTRLDAVVPPDNAAVFEFCSALSVALKGITPPLFISLFLLCLLREGGVAEAHFQWRPHAVSILRRNLRWLFVLAVPLAFVAWFAYGQGDAKWNALVGRGAYIALLFLLGLFAHRVLHPKKGTLAAGDAPGGKIPGSRRFWHLCATVLPVAMSIAACLGYYYTAEELTRRIVRTIWIVVGLLVVRSTIVRAAVTSHRAAMIRKAKQERAAETSQTEPIARREGDARGETVDLHLAEELGEKTRTLLKWLVTFGLIIGVWGIWHDLVPALSFVGKVELWSYAVDAPAQAAGKADSVAGELADPTTAMVTLGDLMMAVITVAATVALATNGPAAMEILVMPWLRIDPGTRFALSALLRYIVVIVGGATAFGMIGIKWSQIQWLAAAITVGLGFGLQEIVANLVSGLIILFERPVRIGDIVTVGGIDGRITRIRIRATTVTDWNRRELIVPNKEFITGQIINWTLSDPVTRVDIPVGIAYGSDTRLARDLLLRIAAECRNVLERPAPEALFKGFGDSVLDFQLRVHIPNREVWADVIHELHTRIDDEFRRAKIEIAFPQRDIHIRSMPPEVLLPAAVRSPAEEGVQVSKPAREAFPGRGS